MVFPKKIYQSHINYYISIYFFHFTNIFYKPWINLKTEQYKNQIKASDSISAISPGIFKNFIMVKVFFVESLSIILIL